MRLRRSSFDAPTGLPIATTCIKPDARLGSVSHSPERLVERVGAASAALHGLPGKHSQAAGTAGACTAGWPGSA